MTVDQKVDGYLSILASRDSELEACSKKYEKKVKNADSKREECIIMCDAALERGKIYEKWIDKIRDYRYKTQLFDDTEIKEECESVQIRYDRICAQYEKAVEKPNNDLENLKRECARKTQNDRKKSDTYLRWGLVLMILSVIVVGVLLFFLFFGGKTLHTPLFLQVILGIVMIAVGFICIVGGVLSLLTQDDKLIYLGMIIIGVAVCGLCLWLGFYPKDIPKLGMDNTMIFTMIGCGVLVFALSFVPLILRKKYTERIKRINYEYSEKQLPITHAIRDISERYKEKDELMKKIEKYQKVLDHLRDNN